MIRTCRECSILLPEDNSKRYGRKCRECFNAYIRGWRKRNKKTVNASHNKWAKNNRKKATEICNRWREKNKAHYNEYHRLYQAELKKRKANDKELERNNNSQMAGNQPGSE